jgi:hypothetical protein
VEVLILGKDAQKLRDGVVKQFPELQDAYKYVRDNYPDLNVQGQDRKWAFMLHQFIYKEGHRGPVGVILYFPFW